MGYDDVKPKVCISRQNFEFPGLFFRSLFLKFQAIFLIPALLSKFWTSKPLPIKE